MLGNMFVFEYGCFTIWTITYYRTQSLSLLIRCLCLLCAHTHSWQSSVVVHDNTPRIQTGLVCRFVLMLPCCYYFDLKNTFPSFEELKKKLFKHLVLICG